MNQLLILLQKVNNICIISPISYIGNNLVSFNNNILYITNSLLLIYKYLTNNLLIISIMITIYLFRDILVLMNSILFPTICIIMITLYLFRDILVLLFNLLLILLIDVVLQKSSINILLFIMFILCIYSNLLLLLTEVVVLMSSNDSIYNVLQLLIIMLLVLSMSSLLTVLERKGLASSQRRLGPSYNGWFGLVQIVMDGMKLVYKDYFRYNNINNKYIMVSCILNFIFSYLLFIFLYIDLVLYINISYLLLFVILILMINHITIIICGFIINNSKWTILSSIRLILLYFVYDIIFILLIIILSGSGWSLYIDNIMNINQYLDIQSSYINMFKYPLLLFVYIFVVLIEAGRIPVDLVESESELISGYSIEYSGFLYALFASAEYSIVLFHSLLLSLLFFSYYSFFILFIHLTAIFLFFIIIRSTLPRMKYTSLFILSFHYILPFILFYFLTISLLW